jgi:hypothetical protein
MEKLTQPPDIFADFRNRRPFSYIQSLRIHEKTARYAFSGESPDKSECFPLYIPHTDTKNIPADFGKMDVCGYIS